MESKGIKVLRFWNNDVLQNTESVLQQIYDALTPALSQRARGLKSPLPLGEDSGEGYQDIPGFCKSAKLDEIKKHDYVLTPGRYVGAADAEEDSEPFGEKMQRLTAALSEQFAESDRLEAEIKKNLAGLGYGI
ncbi:DUF559 domain-containing protein [Mariprofundus erugo]|uniref:DUF559 domain-containing protein n=1 Tax=Mariprofundus erugo TaxID=2528639 RepID=A0A5R9GK81_9PROT|nr:DUF559 domain-containing protein [Mariprofundus erugo]